jgi:hypothetical protein
MVGASGQRLNQGLTRLHPFPACGPITPVKYQIKEAIMKATYAEAEAAYQAADALEA